MSSARPMAYPLRFREILRPYAFGEDWIVRQFPDKPLPRGQRIGETWEVCDRPKESSVILNGALAGATLRQAIDEYGPVLLGEDVARRFGRRFPLLIKFLDATKVLGEQVHPDDALTQARRLDDYSGKTEAWYILQALPGSTVHCGGRSRLTREQLVEALTGDGALSCMVPRPVAPGDALLLYAGTMHYSPGGLLFYEIMQNSDVYVGLGRARGDPPPEQRRHRAEEAAQAVHIEEGFDCRTRPVRLQEGPNARTFVLACQHFALERLDLAEPWDAPLDGRRFEVLSAITGQATVACLAGTERLLPGQTLLLPAGVGAVALQPVGTASLLRAYVPDLTEDIIRPLRARATSDDAIRALGGRTALNPFNALL